MLRVKKYIQLEMVLKCDRVRAKHENLVLFIRVFMWHLCETKQRRGKNASTTCIPCEVNLSASHSEYYTNIDMSETNIRNGNDQTNQLSNYKNKQQL